MNILEALGTFCLIMIAGFILIGITLYFQELFNISDITIIIFYSIIVVVLLMTLLPNGKEVQ